MDLTDPTADNSAYRSIDGFLLPPGKDRIRGCFGGILAGFPLIPLLSWMERERWQTIGTIERSDQ